jgi:hypothetical protein
LNISDKHFEENIMTYRAIGIDDSVNTCDCCGKSGLKSTVTMVDDSGEIVHFGSVCASHNSGKDNKTIKNGIVEDLQNRIDRAKLEYYHSESYICVEEKMNAARKLGLIGKPFRKFCAKEIEFSETVKQSIADGYNLKSYQF